MNNKVLVKLMVPYLDREFEIFVPVNKRVSEVIILLEKALFEMTNGYYKRKNESILIDGESGNVFDINIRVKDAKIFNGSKLIIL